MSRTRLSVIIPCFNEQDRIIKCYQELKRFFMNNPQYRYEIVFVDDGSTDLTKVLLDPLKGDLCVKVLSYPTNRGKGYAVRQGLLNSCYYTKLILDCDLSIPPFHLSWIDFKGEWDVFKANRYFIAFPWTRELLSKGWHLLVRYYLGLKVDTQAPFTILRLPRQLYKRLQIDGFAYDCEIIALAQKRGYRIESVTLPYTYRSGSRVTFRKTLRMIEELRIIKKRLG